MTKPNPDTDQKSDLVEELRRAVRSNYSPYRVGLCHDAANEIERVRAQQEPPTAHEVMRARHNAACYLAGLAHKHLNKLKVRTGGHRCDGRVGLEAVLNAAAECYLPGNYVPYPHEGPARCPTCTQSIDQPLAQQEQSEPVKTRCNRDDGPCAASDALDDITKLCKAPEWEYPGQVVRDVANELGIGSDEMVRALAPTEDESPGSVPSKGIELIAAERTRQVEEEGWTPGHDDGHESGEIAVAAAELAVDGTDFFVTDTCTDDMGPVDMCGSLAKFGWKGTAPDRVRALVIAGALIAAELDRELRALAPTDTEADNE